MTRAGRGESGFTIVEAAVAAFVLTVGLLAGVGVFNDSRDEGATAERHEIALMQAQQAIEEIRGLPYQNVALNASAQNLDSRVSADATQFTVKPGLSEEVVYDTQNGVGPVSTVTVGQQDDPLEMAVYRYVTWRDEECRVVDLSGLGLDLPAAIDQTQTPLNNLLGGLLDSLLNVLNPTGDATVNALKSRLQGLRNALLANEASLAEALGGITELDVCDLDLATLEELQKLDRLTTGLIATGGLAPDLQALQSQATNLLNQLLGLPCSVLGICTLNSATQNAINAVNSQLDCLFGSGSGEAQFDGYLAGILDGLEGIPDDLSNTTHNTKRATVAVVVEPRQGTGPSQPVWASSVISDPDAGLLSSEGLGPC